MGSNIRTVALAGAAGNLGPSILDQLLSAGFEVTVLTRSTSSKTFPSEVKIATVNYDSPESLSAALGGHDAVVSALPGAATDIQLHLIDAAVTAGVKRFIPSEYGSDTTNANNRKLPFFAGKVQTQNYLAEKAETTGLTFTLVINGAFFDWGLRIPFLLDLKGRKAELYDGGDRQFSTTTLKSVAQAVAGVLQHPEETKNRAVLVRNASVTQNQLIKIAEGLTDGGDWETTKVDTAELEKGALEELKKENPNMGVVALNCIRRSIWGEGYGGNFDASADNKLLGVEEFGPAEIEAVVKSCLG